MRIPGHWTYIQSSDASLQYHTIVELAIDSSEYDNCVACALPSSNGNRLCDTLESYWWCWWCWLLLILRAIPALIRRLDRFECQFRSIEIDWRYWIVWWIEVEVVEMSESIVECGVGSRYAWIGFGLDNMCTHAGVLWSMASWSRSMSRALSSSYWCAWVLNAFQQLLLAIPESLSHFTIFAGLAKLQIVEFKERVAESVWQIEGDMRRGD